MMRFELKDTSEHHVVSGFFFYPKGETPRSNLFAKLKKIIVHHKDIIKNKKEYYITKFIFFYFFMLSKIKAIEYGLFL